MTRLFRSKSCGHVVTTSDFRSTTPTTFLYNDLEEEEEEEEEEDEDEGGEEGKFSSSSLRRPGSKANKKNSISNNNSSSPVILPILDILVGALRKSLVTCTSVGIERDDDDIVSTSTSTSTSTPTCIQHISWPSEVKHISHVTFDRFNGFLGLPSDFQLHLPHKVPSASASVFGVSARSMQCSYDDRGNSVPTILLMLQKQLYSDGGLKAEGIFRINADNGQEEYVRKQLNKGVVPYGIDVHCLAGLIKAWFRELPTGILDSLTPEQVMHCNTEEECTQLVKLLAPTETALLDWTINLMADVVLHETYNKMNARNIAMVFAPNMTQMADPLTALIHAVQVMNFLKSLILKTLREREESARDLSSSSADYFPESNAHAMKSNLGLSFSSSNEGMATKNYPRTVSLNMRQLEPEAEEVYNEDEKKGVESWDCSSIASRFDQVAVSEDQDGDGDGDDSGNGDWLSLRRGVRRLCRNPVFQLSKLAKKPQSLGLYIVEEVRMEEKLGHKTHCS